MRRLRLPLALVLLCLAALPAAASAQSSDLSVVVTDSPDPVVPDGNITYTVTVVNNGPQTATNATLGVSHNGSLRFVGVTVPAGWTCNAPAPGSTLGFTCSTASLAAGAAPVLTVVLHADAGLNGTSDKIINTTFDVFSDTADPNAGNDSKTESTAYLTPDADLSVVAARSPNPAAPGENVTFAVEVYQDGPDSATLVDLTATLPSELRFVSLAAPAGWSCTTPVVGASGSLSCQRSVVAPGTASSFTLVASVDPGIAVDTSALTVFAVDAGESDPSPGGNRFDVTTQIDAPDANVGVTLGDSPDPVAAGGSVTYTATVSNAGPGTAGGVVLTDVLPAGLTLTSASPSQGSCAGTTTLTCTIGTMASGASATVQIVATVAAGAAQESTIVNTVSVTTASSDPFAANDSSSASTLVRSPAGLRLTATGPASVVAGEALRYLVTLSNDGAGQARDVVLAMTLPEGAAFVSLEQSAGPAAECAAPSGGSVTCSTATLAGGATQTFALTVRPAAAGTLKAAFAAGPAAAEVSTTVSAPPVVGPPDVRPPVVAPPGQACTSRRRFTLRLMRRDLPGLRVNLRGARVRSAVVRNSRGRTVRRLRFTARRVTVDLRRLRPARYAVRLRLRLRNGRTVTATARYRTCRAPG